MKGRARGDAVFIGIHLFWFAGLLEAVSFVAFALIATRLNKFQSCFCRTEGLRYVFYFYPVERYIYNSISFASEGKITILVAPSAWP